MRFVLLFALVGCGLDPVNQLEKTSDTSDSLPEDSLMLGDLALSPSALDFGTLVIGESDTKELLFINTGEVPLNVASVYLEGDSSFSLTTSIVSFDIDYFSETFLHDSLSLEKKYSVITASKRLNESEDGRKLIRRIATNFFVLILKFFFQTSMSDTHGMKGVRKSSCEKHIEKVVSTQDLFDTELLLRIERSGEKIYEVPAMVNEIRPSVSVIYSRIPRTIYSLIKLRIQLFKESLKTKNL